MIGDIFLWIGIVLAGLALLLLFLIFPALRRHKGRAMFEGKYIAHRGLHGVDSSGGVVPENSLAAFRRAAEKGCAIETDIHLTQDGRVAVFHDDDLNRMCGDARKPEELTLAELKELRLAGTDERIPALEELLTALDGAVPLLIEFKCTDLKTCNALCETAAGILDNYHGDYAIQSFFPFVLRWYRKHRPGVMRGQLSTGFYHDSFPRKLAGALLFNAFGRPDFVSYDMKNKNNVFFRLCTRLGALPLGWTFKDKAGLENARKRFKGYIFENEETIL